MKVPVTKLISVESFPDDVKGWIRPLLGSLNLFTTNVVNALTGKLSFGENIQGQEYISAFTFTGRETPFNIQNNLGVQAKSLSIVGALERGLPVALVCSWATTSDGQIQVKDIIRLDTSGAGPMQVGADYRITIRFTP